MPVREPLTLEELRIIGKYCRTPEVRALLWEVYRLQGILGRVEQIQSMLGTDGLTSNSMFSELLKSLREELDKDPSIQARRKQTYELLYPDGAQPKRTW